MKSKKKNLQISMTGQNYYYDNISGQKYKKKVRFTS